MGLFTTPSKLTNVKNLTGIVVVVGGYGSGKTEVSINLAINRKRAGLDVRVADLDLVNPYFRTREAKETLSKLDIDVVVPPKQYLQADLPILSPAISGLIRQPSQLTLIDAGGNNVGAKVLGALSDALRDKRVHMLQVVNPFRPFTDTVTGCTKMREEIDKASKMRISGIVGNANLIDETTTESIYYGYDFVRSLSDKSRLPLEFVTVESHLLPKIDIKRFSCPVLPINRQLVPPWKKAAKVG